MTNPSRPLRLGFAGTPDFAVPAMERLAGLHTINAVFTQPDRPAGRGRELRAGPVKARALALGLPVHQPPTFKSPEALALLRSLNLEVLVVVAYGLILPAAVLAVPTLGCINIHASLLPRWRGAAPIQRAMLAGDAATGVTTMRMEAGLDTGPMLAIRTTPILPEDTGQILHDRLATLGADLIGDTLAELTAGCLTETPQPAEGVTYAEKILKSEARIDWRRPAADIWRQVRAFNAWPVAETVLNGAQLRIWNAELLNAHDPSQRPGVVIGATQEGIDVACGRGTLRVTRLQLAGRKPLSVPDFLKAQPLAGAQLGA